MVEPFQIVDIVSACVSVKLLLQGTVPIYSGKVRPDIMKRPTCCNKIMIPRLCLLRAHRPQLPRGCDFFT